MTPEAIGAMIQLFQVLEPPAQQAIAALIHKIHHKQLTAQDYLDQAQLLINARTAEPTPAPAPTAPAVVVTK